MQPLDGEFMDCECSRKMEGVGIWGKNLNFEKQLMWNIGRSDGKLVLANAAARRRRVDFWFRVADRRNRLAFDVLGRAAARWRPGVYRQDGFNLFQPEI